MIVTKRNGSTEELCLLKLRKVLQYACHGMPSYVSEAEIESNLQLKLRDGISTDEIQKNTYLTAAELCTPEKVAYRYVAGRLLLYGYRKQTVVDRGYDYFTVSSNGDKTPLSQYFFHVKYQIERGQYTPEIRDHYTDDELIEAGNWIVPERDEDYDYAGAILITERYTLDHELPQEALLTCALLLASVERPESKMRRAKEIYDAVSLRKISLATPMLANLRVPNGNLSSCFVASVEDSLHSIFHEITNAAKISAKGGGLGVNISAIRAEKSWVNGRPNSSGGIFGWVKILNDVSVAVDQGKQICPAY